MSVELARLQQRARSAGHRALLLVSGPQAWARQQLDSLRPYLPDNRLEVSEQGIPATQAREHLGREVDALVWDSFCGFHPSGFGAATGVVRAGGVLVLLAPPLAEWADFADPDYQRLREHQPPYRFLQRLAQVFQNVPEETLALLTPEDALTLSPWTLPAETPSTTLTDDQQQARDAIYRVATGHRHRPLVLRADRGRGKSAVLGLAARELADQGRTVAVTAPRSGALSSFFDWCGETDRVVYYPPDALLEKQPTADVLMVDEAAAIPAPLLQECLRHYPRVVMATTVHGYEGSGRGFDLRFRQWLDDHYRHWKHLTLTQSVRWQAGDPLEALTHRLLLLDAEPHDAPAAPEPPRIKRLDRDALLHDDHLLSGVWGSLVSAHYQTSPDDLRQLLDDPGSELWLAREGTQVVGVLWLMQEGNLDPTLAEAVARSERRPRGHLLAQALTAQAADPALAALRYGRIARIAVHPQRRRQGVGQALVAQVRQDLRSRSVDVLGTSFGASPDVLAFWRRCGLVSLRFGLHRDAASGTHTAMLGEPLSDQAEGPIHRLSQRFRDHWQTLLLTALSQLNSEVALAFQQALPPESPLTDDERRELAALTGGRRDSSATLPALRRLSAQAASETTMAEWSEQDRSLWCGRVLQGRDWPELQRAGLAEGRKDGEQRLRQLAGQLFTG